jgi:hypothetical protein
MILHTNFLFLFISLNFLLCSPERVLPLPASLIFLLCSSENILTLNREVFAHANFNLQR